MSIINQKGIDKGLTITSELHSMIETDSNQEIMLEMKNGLKISLKASYSKQFDEYGPSSQVIIENRVFDAKGNMISKEDQSKMQVQIGEVKSVLHARPDQSIEIKIKPESL